MTYFNRPVSTFESLPAVITAAYKAAGLTPPAPAAEIRQALLEQPSVRTVAAEIAAEAISAPADASQFIEEALGRLARAKAADEARVLLLPALESVTRSEAPRLLDQAAKELTPAFKKVVKQLTTAAKALPETNPLSESAAVQGDHTRELRSAREALALLSTYAYAPAQGASGTVPIALNGLLTIVALPETTTELIEASFATIPPTLNPHELDSTHAVRALARLAEQDTDEAIIAVAAGRFEGVTLELPTRAAMRERYQRASRAHERKVAARSGRQPLERLA